MELRAQHVQLKRLCLLRPANEVRLPSNISSINYVFDIHQCSKFSQLDISFYVALISKQITDPRICSWFGYLVCQLSRVMLFEWGLANRKWICIVGMSTESCHVIWMGPRQPEVSCEQCMKLACEGFYGDGKTNLRTCVIMQINLFVKTVPSARYTYGY